jgi:hypothetical protein
VEHSFENTTVVQVAFEKDDQVAFVSTPGSLLPVAVYGSAAMRVVKLLRFKRYDDFRAVFFESAELAPCRDALRAAGLSMDLTEANLGGGKLVVHDVELARQALDALRLRQIQGKILRKSDVVVSAEMERLVRSLVMANPATLRKNQHVLNEPGELLDLGGLYRARKRLLLEEPPRAGEKFDSVNWVPAPGSDITCAATTTDANRPSLSRTRTRNLSRNNTDETGNNTDETV